MSFELVFTAFTIIIVAVTGNCVKTDGKGHYDSLMLYKDSLKSMKTKKSAAGQAGKSAKSFKSIKSKQSIKTNDGKRSMKSRFAGKIKSVSVSWKQKLKKVSDVSSSRNPRAPPIFESPQAPPPPPPPPFPPSPGNVPSTPTFTKANESTAASALIRSIAQPAPYKRQSVTGPDQDPPNPTQPQILHFPPSNPAPFSPTRPPPPPQNAPQSPC